MKWTKQQETAINARNASFIVSAAAGSGKTAVLTERLMELLADPDSGVRADRIIAVTFTTAAASDLKKKLDRRLRQIISERNGDRHLLQQQVLLQSAKISTINSFCFELIRDHITDQGITSGFGVIDENDEIVIRDRAVNELLDQYSRDDYEKISFLYDKFCLNDPQPLIEAIYSADRFLSSTAIGEKWLDLVVSEYSREFTESVYYDALFENVRRKLRPVLNLAEENIAIANEMFPDMTCKSAEKTLLLAHEDHSRVAALMNFAERNEMPDSDDIVYSSKFSTLVRLKAADECRMAYRDIFKERRERIKKAMGSIVPYFESAPRDFSESAKVAECLAEAVKGFRRIVWEKKCAKNAISFDDGERLALELLSEIDENGRITQSETAKRIADYYDIILVDEYQDSNNKEDLIFKLISKGYKINEKGIPMYGTNAFVVGDVKQSIYCFRLANPRNFLKIMDNSEIYDPESPCENKSILLNRNFRSSPEVIDFVNFFFKDIMTRDCGEIDYTESEYLYFGAKQYENEHSESRLTHITFVDDDNAAGLEDGESLEAEITAEHIAEMLKNGAKVTCENGEERKCTPGDFSILVRTGANVNVYAKALEKRGIPVRGGEEKGYLKSREIAVLTDLLRIIANPLKDVPLAAVMISPMYPFDISDIAVLKSHGRKKHLFTLVRSAAKGELSGVSPSLSERCSEFLNSIDNFRLNAVTMTIGELISSIYDTTDFVSVMQQYTDGEKKRANLRLLIQYARNYEAAAAAESSGGLSGFVAHLDRVIESGDYEQGKVSAASDDRVVVQTLHKSKGLEYPFVFVAELGYKFRHDSERVMCGDDGRMGFVLCEKEYLRRYKTFQQIVLSGENERETRSEELRLMYVALTRAKQQLFVNLKCGEAERKRVNELMTECVVNGSDITFLAGSAKTFSDWFWLVLMTHSEFPAAAELIGLDGGLFGYPSSSVEKKLFELEYRNSIKKAEISVEEAVPAKADPKLVEQLKNMYDSAYDRTLSEIPAKLSVTQISKKFSDDRDFDFKLKRPRFAGEKTKLTGAERGTAIHTFFQYCSFENAIYDPEGELEILREKGFLTKAQAESIELDKVAGFFASELYERIRASSHVEREKKFTVAAGQLDISDSVFDRLRNSDGMIKGIIDLIYEEDDGVVIVDYKSDRGSTEKELRERYGKQLQIYKAALELTTGKKVKSTVLYSIEMKKVINV